MTAGAGVIPKQGWHVAALQRASGLTGCEK